MTTNAVTNASVSYQHTLHAWLDAVYQTNNRLEWWQHNHFVDKLGRLCRSMTIEEANQTIKEVRETSWFKSFTEWAESEGIVLNYQKVGTYKPKPREKTSV